MLHKWRFFQNLSYQNQNVYDLTVTLAGQRDGSGVTDEKAAKPVTEFRTVFQTL